MFVCLFLILFNQTTILLSIHILFQPNRCVPPVSPDPVLQDVDFLQERTICTECCLHQSCQCSYALTRNWLVSLKSSFFVFFFVAFFVFVSVLRTWTCVNQFCLFSWLGILMWPPLPLPPSPNRSDTSCVNHFFHTCHFDW